MSTISIKEKTVKDTYDAFTQPNVITKIDHLLDGQTSVEVVDISPRIVPVGWTSEYMLVRAARCSYGFGIRSPEADRKLLVYLLKNYHTSPIEMMNITFRIVLPKMCAIHLLRHRTARVNEFSQRYAKVPESDSFYNPLNYDNGIRLQSKTNKQGSTIISDEESHKKVEEIKKLYTESIKHIKELRILSHKMSELGLANEIARIPLTMGEYTVMYYQLDMNNLSKFIRLRADFEHAQYETAVIASAMSQLAKQFFPTIISFVEDKMKEVVFSKKEVQDILTNSINDLFLDTMKSIHDANLKPKFLEDFKIEDVKDAVEKFTK